MSHLITPTGEIKTKDFPHFISKDGIKWYVEADENFTTVKAYTHDKPYLKSVELVFDWKRFVDFWEQRVSDKMNGFTSKSEDWYNEIKGQVSKEVLYDCLVDFCASEYEESNFKEVDV